MADTPGSWSSIINIQHNSAIMEFQHTIKYLEETLIKTGPANTTPTQPLPNLELPGLCFPFRKESTNLVKQPRNLPNPLFTKDSKDISERRLQNLLALGLADSAAVGSIWIMSTTILGKESDKLELITSSMMKRI
jgi:hypothetical protein